MILFLVLLLVFIPTESLQLTLGQISNVSCPFSSSPSNSINFTLYLPPFNDYFQQVVVHFHGDVPFYDVYAIYAYGGQNHTTEIWPDSITAVTGGELWLSYGNTTYTVVVNCSLYLQPAQFTLEPVLTQAATTSYSEGGVTLINDSESTLPHSHWFYFVGQMSIVKSEICFPSPFPIAMRITALVSSVTAINSCKQNNVFAFTPNRNFIGFSSGDSLIVTGAGDYSRISFIFIGSVDTSRNLVPIYNQLIMKSYSGVLNLPYYGLYGVKVGHSLIAGNIGGYIPSDTTNMSIYVYNKSLGLCNSACLVVNQGKKFTGPISNSTTHASTPKFGTQIIYAEDFFEVYYRTTSAEF